MRIAKESEGVLRGTERNIHAAYRLIAGHLYGELGEFAYAAFDYINEAYFGGAVPQTLILWDLVEHGRALGWCRSPEDGAPIIKLHPSLVRPKTDNPWNIPTEHHGYCLAFDVLIHEMMHAHVNYNLGGDYGTDTCLNGPTAGRSLWTCHNCPNWINECNRIAAMLGLPADLQMTVAVRKGKSVRRVNEGHGKPGSFPRSIPERVSFYSAKQLPFGRRES